MCRLPKKVENHCHRGKDRGFYDDNNKANLVIQGVFLFWHVWHSHILINFWPKIMFLDIFHIYIPFIFCKKITELLCHYFTFYRIFRKATNFGEIFKNIPFFCRNYNKIAIISWFQSKFLLKLLFFSSKHSKQYKNTKKV